MLAILVRPALASLVAAAVALTLAAAASAAPKPPERTVTFAGATGRFLLDGRWRLRRDPHDKGLDDRWQSRRSTSGWSSVTVPNAWNNGNYSPRSMGGGVAWYRKDFELPSAAARYSWLVRFESTRYRVRAWLNGHEIGGHAGAYLPFELRLKGLSRSGVNRLVVRVDNRMRATDVPPRSETPTGKPNGGWWNYGGLLGDVYLRRVDRIDISDVRVLPHLPCPTCDATMEYRATVRNYSAKPVHVTVTSRFGEQVVALGAHTIGAGGRTLVRGTTTVVSPHLWSPEDPFLYRVTLDATAVEGGQAGWQLESGIRSVTVAKGRLLLNGRPMSFRGGFFHQDSPAKGGAADPARMRLVVDRLKALGGTLLRTHYPMDPYMHELGDREGVFLWSEIPVYQIDSELIAKGSYRRKAFREMRENILDKASHPSVLTWSMGNELASEPGTGESKYFHQQAARIRRLDPPRPVSLVILGYPYTPCQRPAYERVDLIGVNTYFGWYPGPNGSIADRRQLSPYLDYLRGCYPDKAIANTEFGAEANRSGPAEERGTYAFQKRWNAYTLGVFAKKDWLSGATAMLLPFRCRPEWSGGNPRPTPPMHEKGVLHFDGSPKPAAAVVSNRFHKTQQYGLPGP